MTNEFQNCRCKCRKWKKDCRLIACVHHLRWENSMWAQIDMRNWFCALCAFDYLFWNGYTWYLYGTWWIIHYWWKVVKQYFWKLHAWKNLIFCTPCFYFLGALCLSWWWEHVTSLPQGGEARKRLIAVLAVFSLGNDKQFGGTPLSQIESLQTNCNCQIAQFRTIRRFYPAAKRQHRGKNRFSDRKFWTSKLPL